MPSIGDKLYMLEGSTLDRTELGKLCISSNSGKAEAKKTPTFTNGKARRPSARDEASHTRKQSERGIPRELAAIPGTFP